MFVGPIYAHHFKLAHLLLHKTCMPSTLEVAVNIEFSLIKHGKKCTSMDMLYNGVPQQICHIARITDATSEFFKQGRICCYSAIVVDLLHNEFVISQEPLTPLLDSLNKIKHGKTCTFMDMLYNDVPQQICHIAGTTDATSGFFKQAYSRLKVAALSSLLQLSGRLQLINKADNKRKALH
ncbi:uncharacterized protein LOC129887170 isoform X2 [Solanum dulcamara]|uniref:uncharacterized protein LOC129887170 isoform X2 n=1 Tax=Solanum dulcamara TaxID=45834 RepID=UPI002486BE81|nr:uncharacterized protein LOC129887170 isoform X2 [Solanum dulcamara]